MIAKGLAFSEVSLIHLLTHSLTHTHTYSLTLSLTDRSFQLGEISEHREDSWFLHFSEPNGSAAEFG